MHRPFNPSLINASAAASECQVRVLSWFIYFIKKLGGWQDDRFVFIFMVSYLVNMVGGNMGGWRTADMAEWIVWVPRPIGTRIPVHWIRIFSASSWHHHQVSLKYIWDVSAAQ